MANERSETSAGGVVYRRSGERTGEGGSGDSGVDVAIAEQRDRLTGALTIRLPKGHIEPGETLEQAAIREVEEEFGLRTKIVGPLGTVRYEYREGGAVPIRKQVHYFLHECLPGEPLPLDGEMQRVYWCSLDEAERSLTFDTERSAIAWARAQLEN